MPVSKAKKVLPNIRVGLEPPSPSITSSADDEDRRRYFIENPDYEFDQLPQPYKLIDKTLEELLDVVWDKIIEFETYKQLEKEKKKLPIFSNPTVIECDIQSIDDCCMSSDDNFVFVACSNRIYVYDCISYKEIASIPLISIPETESGSYISHSEGSLTGLTCTTTKLKIKELIVKQLSNTVSFLLVLLEDSLLTFAFSQDYLLPMKVFNDFDASSQSSTKVNGCKISIDINMIAVTCQTSNGTNVIEICQLPIDNWIKEIESTVNHLNNDAMSQQDENLLEVNSSQFSEEKEIINEKSSSPDSTMPSSSAAVKASFSKVSLVCKVKTPKLTPFTASSLTYALRAMDLEGHTIGSGINHVLSPKYFETVNKQFNIQMQQFVKSANLKLASKTEVDTTTIATHVHFLLPLENARLEEITKYNALSVWWTGGNQIFIYNFGKNIKDIDLSPYMVLLNSDRIICSAVSPTTCLLAVALYNGNIIVWERSSGKPMHIWNLGCTNRVKELDFFALPPANNVQEINRLLIATYNGDLYQIVIDIARNRFDDIAPIKDRSTMAEGDVLQFLPVSRSAPLICVIRANQIITVCDLETNLAVCHFKLPSGCEVAQGSLVCSTLATDARTLFVLGKEDIDSLDDDTLSIFVFSLEGAVLQRMVHESEGYDNEFKDVSNPLERKFLSALQVRMETKGSRQVRHERRWKEYHKELNLRKSIQNAF